ncbi:MAG TPA: succinate dehydrogenase cytochrome b subunit [Ilumatobacteraceae bacterium]|nr:succinate dehydrogenase cytochrome b subunit [Ilumatobacteraceae bacterium]
MAHAVKTRGPESGSAAVARKRKKFFLLDLYNTAVGKKYVMAITGLMMIGFVVFHMIGNLKMYLGRDDINHYSHFLQQLLYPILPKNGTLWLLRGGLIVAVLLHIHAAYSLTVMNRNARSVKYQGPRDYQVANFASRTMRWSGIIIFLFVVWHLLDLTFGKVNTLGTDGTFVKADVYGNIVRSFDRPLVSIFYILANLALGFHLFHGVWSLFQSMGWNSPRFNAWRRYLAIAIAAIVVVGNVSFPIAVMAGVVG